jgi:hypothetical protein
MYAAVGARRQYEGERASRNGFPLLAVTAETSGEPVGWLARLGGLAGRLSATLALAAGVAALGFWLLLANPGEGAWARCLWQEVPTSSANWLAMDAAGFPPGVGAPVPGELLKARLLGACSEALAPPGRPRAGVPDWPELQRQLAARAPSTALADSSDPRAFVCELYFADDGRLADPAGHDWGYGDFNTGVIVGRRLSEARSDGQRLTADNSVRFCRLIGPDGRPGRDRFQRAPLADLGG